MSITSFRQSHSKKICDYQTQLSQVLGLKPQSTLSNPKFSRPSQTPEKNRAKTNKEFRNIMHLLADLPNALQSATPLNADTISCIAGYIGSDCMSLQSVYSIAPELLDPKIPLRDSLQLTTSSSIAGMQSIKRLKSSEEGTSGTVDFVHFKNDILSNRWFAIKQPTVKLRSIFKEQTSKRAFKNYKNTLTLALKIGNHPNFMQVHGIVFKEKANQQTEPYLILSYIDGIRLRDIKNLTPEQKIHLLTQLKSAFTHLLELGISPEDANGGNFLITKDNTLKLIDFDAWTQESPLSQKLALHLHEIFYCVANRLSPPQFFHPPLLSLGDIKRSFEQQIDDNIAVFRAREELQNPPAIDPYMFDEWLE